MKNQAFPYIILTALISCAATVTILQWDVILPGSRGLDSSSIPVVSAAPEPPAKMSSDEEINIKVYNNVSPGVVNITSIVVEYDFFFSPIARPGTGSGVVLDKRGNILTNFHVISDRERLADRLEVTLPDQSKHRARVVGVDPQNDLAVLRLDNVPADRLQPVSFGDSSRLQVGQKVLAIGNPFRLQNTLTVGIISAIGRTIQTDRGDQIENVIQTDAAINQGNSGGPLLNTEGEMIGINTSIVSPSGGNVGIGFAIPSNTVQRVVGDLIEHGRVLRPWLGIVDGYSLTDDLSSALDLPVSRGVLVRRIFRGGPADAAGIRGFSDVAILYNERIYIGGDIVTGVDSRMIASWDDLQLALESKKPGDTVELTLYRDGREIKRSVLLKERPGRRYRF